MKTVFTSCTPSLVFILLFCLTPLLGGCNQSLSNMGRQTVAIAADDPPWVARFKRTLGRSWYQVKMYGLDIGRASRERSISRFKGEKAYRLDHREEMVLQIYGTTNHVKRSESKYFAVTPPNDLIAYVYTEQSGENRRSIHITPNDRGVEVTITGNDSRQQMTGPRFSYSLKDELEPEMWAASAQRANESKYIKRFIEAGMQFGSIEEFTATVREIGWEVRDDKREKTVRISFTNHLGSTGLLIFDGGGRLLQATSAEMHQYDYRRKRPQLPEEPIDLYVHNMVPITAKIGSPDTIEHLSLRLEGPHTDLLEDGLLQQVSGADGQDAVYLTLASAGQTERRPPSFQPEGSDAPPHSWGVSQERQLRALASAAVGDAAGDEAKIRRLLKYVDEYLSNQYTFDTDLQGIIRGKKGDCSEHAEFFTALAQAIDIPCRSVLGLVYIGDWCQGFGLHAWNEVLVDGRWRAVDASQGEFDIAPVYIRFPDDPAKVVRLLNSVHEMKIFVEQVEHTK